MLKMQEKKVFYHIKNTKSKAQTSMNVFTFEGRREFAQAPLDFRVSVNIIPAI